MRILALDVGTKRIGAAMSDELLLTAQGLDTIRRRDDGTDMKEIAAIVENNGVREIVLGLPINMDGSQGPKAREALDFAARLSAIVKVPVKTWDERLTTMQAERALLEADMSRSKRRGVIDKLAAQIILQSYLDALKRSRDNA